MPDGNFKIIIIDLDTDKEIMNVKVDRLEWEANRPMEPHYRFGGYKPHALKQIGPTSYSITGLDHKEMFEHNTKEKII